MARFRTRSHRGSTSIIAVLTLLAAMVTTGVEINYGRLVTSRQKDQVMADAACMAAMLYLPRTSSASAAGDRVLGVYRQSYNSSFAATYTYTPSGSSPAT